MKEIDLLPEWYKSDRRRQISYCTQCVVLLVVLMMMIIWNFIAAYPVSRAAAEFARMAPERQLAEVVLQESAELESALKELQKKAAILGELIPKSSIRVANVLAEMSFLIGENIVLRKVEFKAERFVEGQKGQAGSGSAVRIVRVSSDDEKTLSLGDVRFRVVIDGVASDASNVAELICKLEDSPYFCQIIPSFSRNTEVKVAANPAGKDSFKTMVSEFEIGCYLANYRQQRPCFVKDAQSGKLER